MSTRKVVAATHVVRMLWAPAAVVCVLAAVCEPSSALADNGPPSQIGNIYGGFDHQPTQSEVLQRERAAKINLNDDELKRNATIVDQLYRELENKAATASPTTH
jgi:hypothetical protein